MKIRFDFITELFGKLTLRDKIIFIGFVILIILIPLTTFLLHQRQRLSEPPPPKQKATITKEKDSSSPSASLKSTDQPKTEEKDSKPTTTTLNVGSTLNIRISIEGRSSTNQTAKVFVGIALGQPSPTPKYLLTFSVDFPASGVFKGLSLAGLEIGSTYTAYIKGPAQIATASAFKVPSTETDLNGGNPLVLLSGDLNEDNAINSADYSIARGVLGKSSKDKEFNLRADFNGDGVINVLDIGLVIKNFGKIGTSGAWQSTPKVSTPAAKPASGSAEPTGGYWLWVPEF